eukprot:6466909-Amphidinium_carterae.2
MALCSGMNSMLMSPLFCSILMHCTSHWPMQHDECAPPIVSKQRGGLACFYNAPRRLSCRTMNCRALSNGNVLLD